MSNYRPSLDRLARLAQTRPTLLAGPLKLYQEQEGLDDEQLAAQLGCEVEALARLALCERPRPAPHFREDVERIARYIQADTLQLAMVIRNAETRESFTRGSGASVPTLLAARDNEDEEEADMDNGDDESKH
jgi:transcriptional regulator with XRE-family HTH domain